MNEDLAVAVRTEVVSLLDQLSAQFDVVIDLAVTNDPYGFVFVAKRLLSSLDVDDGEPGVAEQATSLKQLCAALVVRAPMTQQILRLTRPGPQTVVCGRRRIEQSIDSTHVSALYALRPLPRKPLATGRPLYPN